MKKKLLILLSLFICINIYAESIMTETWSNFSIQITAPINFNLNNVNNSNSLYVESKGLDIFANVGFGTVFAKLYGTKNFLDFNQEENGDIDATLNVSKIKWQAGGGLNLIKYFNDGHMAINPMVLCVYDPNYSIGYYAGCNFLYSFDRCFGFNLIASGEYFPVGNNLDFFLEVGISLNYNMCYGKDNK